MDPSKTETQAPMALLTSDSLWVSYLTGKKMAPAAFFKQVEKVVDVADRPTGKSEGKRTRIISRPDEEARSIFAEAVATRPDGVERLLLMVHAAASASDAVRRIVVELTGMGLVRLRVLSSTEQLDGPSFNRAVSSWLARITEAPLRSSTLDRLLLLLVYGWHQRFLDQDAVYGFLASIRVKTKRPVTRTQVSQTTPKLLEAIVVARKSESVLQATLAYLDEARAEQLRMTTELRMQGERIACLLEKIASLNTDVSDLNVQVGALREQKEAAELTSASLQKQVDDTRASYQHKLDDVRGHIRGTLEGQLTRWLETGLDASRSNPPRTEVIEERLEEALKLIEKELRWLQPSA